jgi:hypothetical protein
LYYSTGQKLWLSIGGWLVLGMQILGILVLIDLLQGDGPPLIIGWMPLLVLAVSVLLLLHDLLIVYITGWWRRELDESMWLMRDNIMETFFMVTFVFVILAVPARLFQRGRIR